MARPKKKTVVFDFNGVDVEKPKKILANISAAAVVGKHVWTASDEERMLQCFRLDADKYVLERSLNLDDAIADELPRPKKEADIEALAFDGRNLWFCGSHCQSRPKLKTEHELPQVKVDAAPTRSILGRISLRNDGSWDGKSGRILSTTREGALRRLLRKDRMLARFLDIPSKENGLDIEGMACIDKQIVLGLRGPVISGRALLLHLELDRNLRLKSPEKKFLDLGGLGIRDLHRDGRRLLILAGPTLVADGPVRVYAMTMSGQLENLNIPMPSGPDDHPEAIATLRRNGRRGLLMFSDGSKRVNGLRYTADWYPL